MSAKKKLVKMSALFKRAEQLKRYEESDTNRESTQPKKNTSKKVKFSSGCIFLASCAAGDKDEVLLLLNDGADIDTANVDGLTALHQVNDLHKLREGKIFASHRTFGWHFPFDRVFLTLFFLLLFIRRLCCTFSVIFRLVKKIYAINIKKYCSKISLYSR